MCVCVNFLLQLPRPPPNAIVYAVGVPGDPIGLQLAETPRGLAVRGFARGFDIKILKDVRVGDLLVSINSTVRALRLLPVPVLVSACVSMDADLVFF